MAYNVANFPTSYKDASYDELDAQAEKATGLPPGLLSRIRLVGEKSNADQVSSAGAKSPYQIIESTRNAILEKYKIDPYLNPKNAALGAAYLLKEGLQRNGGNVREAVGEYIGGTDRKNWGKQTRAYIERVAPIRDPESTGSFGELELSPVRSPQDIIAAQQKPTINYAAIIDAYKTGKMSPEEATEFEADVNAGRFVLPGGLPKADKPKEAVPEKAEGTIQLNQKVFDAYNRGIEWERAGNPDDKAPADVMRAADRQMLEQDIVSGEATPEPSLKRRMKDVFTGELRQTEESVGLPNFLKMPDFAKPGANLKDEEKEFSLGNVWSRLKSALPEAATAFTSITGTPDEIEQAAKSKGLETRRDSKGNVILKSKIDGKEYVIPPGFTMDSFAKALTLGGLYSVGGAGRTLLKETVGTAATEAGIQGVQAAGGGDFSGTDVALAAAAPTVVRAVTAPFRAGARTATAAALPDDALRAAATPAPAATAKPTLDEVTTLAGKAATRPGPLATGARQELAQMVEPDAAALAAAERLGMPVSPVTLSQNELIQQVRGAAASKVGSPAAVQAAEEFERLSQQTYKGLSDLGASPDIGAVSEKIRTNLIGQKEKLEKLADAKYTAVNEAMQGTKMTPGETTKLVEDWLQNRSMQTLSPGQKKLIAIVREGAKQGGVRYADLDSIRKQIGQQMRGKDSAFSSTESGELRQMYGALARDQESAIEAIGKEQLLNTYKEGAALVANRKELEDGIKAAYGRHIDGDIVPALRNAVATASRGSAENLSGLLKTIRGTTPGETAELRKEALSTAMLAYMRPQNQEMVEQGAKFSFQQYNKMYRGMMENSPVRALVMQTMGKQAARSMDDLYTVSKRIEQAYSKVLHTGKANQEIIKNLNGAEGMLNQMIQLAKTSAARGAGTELATSMMMGPSGGGFLAGAIHAAVSGKNDVLKAVGELLTSPEFQILVEQQIANGAPTKQAVSRMANSSRFKNVIAKSGAFTDEVKARILKDATERERIILSALQSSRNTIQTENE